MENIIKLLGAIHNGYVNPTKVDTLVFSGVLNSIFREIPNKKPVEYVSKKALELARKMKIDLSKANWKDQPKFDKGRLVFYYEHCNTVKMLTDDILKTNKDIAKVIKGNVICWITREENKKLDKNGYRDNRPGGWKKCYKECGIEVLRNKGGLYV